MSGYASIQITYKVVESEDSYEREIHVYVKPLSPLNQTEAERSKVRMWIAQMRDANVIHEEDSVTVHLLKYEA